MDFLFFEGQSICFDQFNTIELFSISDFHFIFIVKENSKIEFTLEKNLFIAHEPKDIHPKGVYNFDKIDQMNIETKYRDYQQKEKEIRYFILRVRFKD